MGGLICELEVQLLSPERCLFLQVGTGRWGSSSPSPCTDALMQDHVFPTMGTLEVALLPSRIYLSHKVLAGIP